MKIQNHKLQNILQEFRHIQPRADFSRESRALILAQKPLNKTATAPVLVSWTDRLRTGAITTIRIGSFVAATTAVVLIAFYATRELSPLLLPGLNAQRITAEAQMLNSAMNIELNNLGYFDASSQESAAVLEQLSQKQLSHLNDTIIKSEAKEINQNTLSSIPASSSDLNTFIQELSK